MSDGDIAHHPKKFSGVVNLVYKTKTGVALDVITLKNGNPRTILSAVLEALQSYFRKESGMFIPENTRYGAFFVETR